MKTMNDIECLRVLVHRKMRNLRHHEDIEDIEQEAWITSWQSWERLKGRYAASTIVNLSCRQAFHNWVRSRKARNVSRIKEDGGSLPQVLFLNDLLATVDDYDENDGHTLTIEADFLAAPDDCGLVIDRLAAQEIADLALASMTEPQRQSVRASVMASRSYAEAGAMLGINPKSVHKAVRRGLIAAAAALGETP